MTALDLIQAGQWSRAEIERAIEDMIALLDRLDPDPDLEPTFGYLPPGEVDECEPDFDGEPSLGWTVHGGYGVYDGGIGFTDGELGEAEVGL